VRVVETFFEGLDFRRFQIPLDEDLPIDDASSANLKKLIKLGDGLAKMIAANQTDVDVVKDVYRIPETMRKK
jgi:hypothetical protein